MAKIPQIGNINTPVQQAAPSPVGAGRVAVDPAGIGNALGSIAEGLGQFAQMQGRSELAATELDYKQQRAKEAGEWQVKLTEAKNQIESRVKLIDTDAKLSALPLPEKQQLIASYTDEALFDFQSAPQYIKDAIGSSLRELTMNADQLVQAQALQTQYAQYDAQITAKGTQLSTVIEEGFKTGKTPAEIQEVTKSGLAELKTEIENAPIGGVHRAKLQADLLKTEASLIDTYKKAYVKQVGDQEYATSIKTFATVENSAEAAKDPIAAYNKVQSEKKPAQESLAEFERRKITASENIAANNVTNIVRQITGIDNNPYRQMKEARTFNKVLMNTKDGQYTYLPFMDFKKRNEMNMFLNKLSEAPKPPKEVGLSPEKALEYQAQGDALSLHAGMLNEKIEPLRLDNWVESYGKRAVQASRLKAANVLTADEVSKFAGALVESQPNMRKEVLTNIGRTGLQIQDRTNLIHALRSKGPKGELVAGIVQHELGPTKSTQKKTSELLAAYNALDASTDKDANKMFQQTKNVAKEQLKGTGLMYMQPHTLESMAGNVALLTSQGKSINQAINEVVGKPIQLMSKAPDSMFSAFGKKPMVIPNGVSEASIIALNNNRRGAEKEAGLLPTTLDGATLINTDFGVGWVKNGAFVTRVLKDKNGKVQKDAEGRIIYDTIQYGWDKFMETPR